MQQEPTQRLQNSRLATAHAARNCNHRLAPRISRHGRDFEDSICSRLGVKVNHRVRHRALRGIDDAAGVFASVEVIAAVHVGVDVQRADRERRGGERDLVQPAVKRRL